jgi:hypothetical protein
MTAKATPDITFFMIGCQRCGTTWTDAALRDHPQVYLPAKKQSYFFDRNYEKGIDWFMDRFDEVEKHHQAVGEIATGYCLLDSIPLMAKHFPNIKLLMVMRNPTDRAYSNFQTRQIESNWASFEDAIESDPDFLERGQYIDQIDTLLKYYDREQILFLLYEDLHTNDRAYLTSVLKFIGVESNVESKMIGQRKNASLFPHLRMRLHQFGLKTIVSLISRSWVGDWVRRSRKNKGKSYSPMNLETKKKLINHFTPYNDRLSAFLQRDLSKWNES